VTRSGLRRLLLVAGATVLCSYVSLLVVFQTSKRRTLRRLAELGRVDTTGVGPIEYRLEGEGPTVLILPGSFGGYDQARLMGRWLTRSGFRILAVSRPGYLRTPLEVGRSPREQADAFAVLLDSLGLDRVAVLGGSGGGPAALELAARHPARAWGLVLIAALSGSKAQSAARSPPYTGLTDALFGEGFSTWWQLVKLERSRLRALDSPIFSPDTRRELGGTPQKLDEFFELAWFRFPPALREAGYLNDREQFGAFAFDAFDAITAPTLVVHGTEDRNAPIEHGDRSASRIAGAEYLRLEGGDHYSVIAHPEAVWSRVAEFLRRHAPLPDRAESPPAIDSGQPTGRGHPADPPARLGLEQGEGRPPDR
jgi:pimeloyl-ACP methyl ester carboxylesterase